MSDTPDTSWLLSPVSVSTLANDYFGQNALVVKRQQRDYYTSLLPESALEFALHSATRTMGCVDILQSDESGLACAGHAQALAAFQSGRSLRINSIQSLLPELTLLCRNIEQDLSCIANANMYLTPEGKRALARHFDTHDVFVLQIYGAKTWRLYESSNSYPLENLPLFWNENVRNMRRYRLNGSDSDGSNLKITQEVVLEAGDLLYLPRGHWHEAHGDTDLVSCHLTIGVQSFTYLDLLTAVLCRASATSSFLRQALPGGFASTRDCYAEIDRQMKTIIAEFPSFPASIYGAIDDLVGIMRRSHKTTFENGLLRSRLKSPVVPLHLGSRMRRRRGMQAYVSRNEDVVNLSFGHRVFAADLRFEEACRLIAGSEPFAISALPVDLSDEEKLSFANQLQAEGLLITEESTASRTAPTNEWLPVRISSDRSAVEWLDMGKYELLEPFFHQTIELAAKKNGKLPMRTTSLMVLAGLEEEIHPSGFIFHISRCGSTLLANALRLFSGTLVLSEPEPVSIALRMLAEVRGGSYADLATAESVLKGVVNAFGRRRIGTEESFVIKFTSWNILLLSAVRRLWPDVPIIVVVRDPIEVAVSCLQAPPAWGAWKERWDLCKLLSWTHEEWSQLSHEGFYARMIGEFCSSALRDGNNLCRVLDYSLISTETVLGTARFFNLNTHATNVDRISQCLSRYSKDTGGEVLFHDDSASKQMQASEMLRAEVSRWAQPAYDEVLTKLGANEVHYLLS